MEMVTIKRALLAGLAISLSAALPLSAATMDDVLPIGWIGVGNAGSGTADGDVSAAPTPGGGYTYVSTADGLTGVGALAGVGGPGEPTDGSTLTTSVFAAAAGDVLNFFFNFVTSDGAGFADYAWAQLLDATDTQVALLFTARTTPGGSSVPGFSMPSPAATLIPASVNIIPNATNWSALGTDSGSCFATGCGSTDWVQSLYTVASAGSYKLQFGVTNWDDTFFDTGMAVAGVNIGGVLIDPENPTPSPIPLPAAGWLMLASLGGIAALRRTKAV